MEFAIQIVGWCIGLPLEILIIAALLGGLWSRLTFLFVYVIALFLATAVEIPVYAAYYTGNHQAFRSRAWTYWLDEVVLLALILLVVLNLVWRASARMEARRAIRLWLIAGSAAGIAISWWLRYDPRASSTGQWMTPWTRDLYLGAAALDLALWMLLLAGRGEDHLLLLMSGALGLEFTGETIGGSLRNLAVEMYGAAASPRAHAVAFAGNVITMLANVACLYIWWRALRSASRIEARGA